MGADDQSAPLAYGHARERQRGGIQVVRRQQGRIPRGHRADGEVTGGAVPAIYFQDQRVSLEQLGQTLDAAKRKDQSIIIKADRSASYETVARVTNAVLEHGITSVALAATPPQ